MTQIYIDGNDIQRVVCMEFDIDIGLSYEDFCSNPEYMKLFQEIKGKEKVLKYPLLDLLSLWYDEWINENIQMKGSLMLKYDLVEKYENWMACDLLYNISDQDKNRWNLFNNLNLDIIKYHLTRNYMLIDREKRKNDSDFLARLFSPGTLQRLKYGSDLDPSVWRKIRKSVVLTQKLIQHKRVQYLILMSLLSEEPLYLITSPTFLNFKVVSAGKLSKHIKNYSLVKDLGWFVKYIEKEDVIKEIKRLKDLHWKDGMDKVIKDLLDMIKKTGTLRINLDIQNYNPMYMKWQFKTNDMNKYAELKEYASDYWFVAEKNHKWSKKTIVGEKEFKYKKSWNKDSNK